MLNIFTLMYRWISRILKIVVVFLAAVFLLELSFRYYVIDFYQPELNALNKTLPAKDEKRQTVLVLGDSFSANAESYVSKLQGGLPYTFINSAVSGTGIMEASFMASSRIKRFKPNVVVYQIYMGNDFLDIRHRPTGEISSARRIYHGVSDYTRVFKFLNYRFGQIRASVYQDLDIDPSNQKTEFSVERYHPRQKMIFKEEPLYLKNSLDLKNGRDEDFKTILTRLHEIERQLDAQTRLIILVVPHCAQVNSIYQNRMKLLGSESEDLTSEMVCQKIEKEFSNHTIVNVLSEFKESDSTNHRLYRENDPHLSDIGQSFLADIMRPYLKDEFVE